MIDVVLHNGKEYRVAAHEHNPRRTASNPRGEPVLRLVEDVRTPPYDPWIEVVASQAVEVKQIRVDCTCGLAGGISGACPLHGDLVQ